VGFIPSARTDLTEKSRLRKQTAFFWQGHKDWTLTPTLRASPFGSLSAGVGCRITAKKPQRGFFLRSAHGHAPRACGFKPYTHSKTKDTTFVVSFLFCDIRVKRSKIEVIANKRSASITKQNSQKNRQ